MAQKPIKTLENFQQINLSLALGFLVFVAMVEITPIKDFVLDALAPLQLSDPVSHAIAIFLNWWLSSAILFAIFHFTNLLDWLKFNRLTRWAFWVVNIAILVEMAFLLFYGRPHYFMRAYFEAPWKIGLIIGCASLIGCTIWYQVIKRYSLVRNTLSVLLASD